MTPEGIQEKFNLYRKWFRTLLIKEFLNLPLIHQQKFLILAERFLKDCKKVHEEAKKIQEKIIKVIVKEVLEPDNKEENYIVCGIPENTNEEIKVIFPVSKPRPKWNEWICCVVYSMDNKIWYSSKEELIGDWDEKRTKA